MFSMVRTAMGHRPGRRAQAAAVIMGGAGLIMLAPGVAHASQAPAAGTRTIAAAGWVAVPHGPVPAGSKLQIVQGQRDGQGHCSFTVSDTLRPGQWSLQREAVAYNLTACQARMASWTTSRPVGARAETPPPGGFADTRTSPRQDARSTAGSVLQAASHYSAGYVDTHTSDRFAIWVNEVKDTVNWYWDGFCVDTDWGSYYYWWLSNTGWQLEGNNWNNNYSCSAAQSSSYVHYYNYPVCGGTDVYYNRNTIYGWNNGKLTDRVGWSLGGYCTALLTGPWISLIRTN
jgi:hypothetical protein